MGVALHGWSGNIRDATSLSFFFVNIVNYLVCNKCCSSLRCGFELCIIGHHGNEILDAGGDDGDDRLPGRYVVL